jgi:hypothetical protein
VRIKVKVTLVDYIIFPGKLYFSFFEEYLFKVREGYTDPPGVD